MAAREELLTDWRMIALADRERENRAPGAKRSVLALALDAGAERSAARPPTRPPGRESIRGLPLSRAAPARGLEQLAVERRRRRREQNAAYARRRRLRARAA